MGNDLWKIFTLKINLCQLFSFFPHTFCLMIISLMSSRSPTITLCDFITRSSRDSQSVSSVQTRLKSARAGTSNSKEDGISSLETAVSLVTTGCVTRVTVWLGAKFFFFKKEKRKKEKLETQEADFNHNKTNLRVTIWAKVLFMTL